MLLSEVDDLSKTNIEEIENEKIKMIKTIFFKYFSNFK